MLTTTNLVGFGSGLAETAASPAAASFTANTSSTSASTTYNFASQSLGAAAADRYIVVGTTSQSGTNIAVSSLSVGGISATPLLSIVQINNTIELWIAAVPTGTSATVSVTWASTRSRCAIVVWRLVGLVSPTAYDTAQEFSFGASAGDGALDIPAGGVALGMASDSGTGGRNWTWAGLTESVDLTFGSGRSYTGATGNFASAQSGLAVSATPSGSTTSGIFAAIALR